MTAINFVLNNLDFLAEIILFILKIGRAHV